MNLPPPYSQKAADRPISFFLDDQAFGRTQSINLVIRPEELTRTDPSKINPQQTFGGAWADNFGPGIATISLNGHTGWRRSEADYLDGSERFQELHKNVFVAWHEQRAAAISAGRNPDNVKLIFADALDQMIAVVAPMTFTLRRSKSRPLLSQFQISMTVLSDNLDSPFSFGSGIDADVMQDLGLDSLSASIDELTVFLDGIRGNIDNALLAPVMLFMQQTQRLYGSVRGAISAGSSIAGSLIRIAQTTAMAGINIFRTLAAVAAIPMIAKSLWMQVAGAYSNIWCVLKNALLAALFYQDYSDVYGASNCSSTSGGMPMSVLAGQNPFYSVVPTRSPLPVSISNSSMAGMQLMAKNDPVLAPISTPSLTSVMGIITDGFVVQ